MSIAKIDSCITEQISLFSKKIDKLVFKKIIQFELKADTKKIIDAGYSGIYLIEIKNCKSFPTIAEWIHDFQEKWDHKKYYKKYVPTTKKKRILKNTALKEWMPLYIGKSKNIEKRLNEHIVLGLEKTTFALKLLARNNFFGKTIRISTIELSVTNYDILVPVLEKHFRDKINPIIGKQ